MSYILRTTKKFDKAVKLCIRRKFPMEELRLVMSILVESGKLPPSYRPHKLKGIKGNCTWECHIQPDWLLVWEQHEDELVMLMLDTGTHSDLFG